MNLTLPPLSRRRLPALIAVLLSLTGWGCAGNSTTRLTVRSLDKKQTFQQHFPRAYAGRTPGGDYDVVLVQVAKQEPGRLAPVRQVMHVRLLWKPMKGTKLDHPSATNATLDWVVSDPTDGAFIAYSGAGFVDVRQKGNTALLDIRNATLSPGARQGGMNDPIGRSKLSGIVVARTDRGQVGTLLAEVKQTVATPETGARSASSRMPVDHE